MGEDSGGMDGGGMDGGGMGSMSGPVVDSTTGGGSGGTDDDSGASVLQSLGYVESGAGTRNKNGDSTRSVTSVLKTILFLVVGLFFVGSFLYFLLTGVLTVLGV